MLRLPGRKPIAAYFRHRIVVPTHVPIPRSVPRPHTFWPRPARVGPERSGHGYCRPERQHRGIAVRAIARLHSWPGRPVEYVAEGRGQLSTMPDGHAAKTSDFYHKDRTINNGGALRRKEWPSRAALLAGTGERLAGTGGRSVPHYGSSGLSERRLRLCFSVALRVPRSVSVMKITCLPLIVNPRPDMVSDTAPGSGAPPASRCVSLVGHVLCRAAMSWPPIAVRCWNRSPGRAMR